MAKKKRRTTQSSSPVRPVYDPTIREVIARGELEEMKSLLVQAKRVMKEQGDLPSAVARLEAAIKKIGD
jgi:Domain of unknown function (DUF1843)